MILLVGLWGMCPNVEARERYILRFHKIVGCEERYAWVYDNAQNQILWKRRLTNWITVHWSRDRKALAIECQIPQHNVVETGVLVWREGYRLRFFRAPGSNDYPMGCVWSSDNRRLLVRAGGSDAADADYGELFCLWMGRWPQYKVFKLGDAAKMAWKSNKTAIFWERESIGPRDNPGYGALQKPRLWQAP
ncbi:hypothetical protein IAD21_04401 [Abditibacteriota bacterium]|nr:hypothetical protein IAD21_04401 [Abditibacteriota bacterium]